MAELITGDKTKGIKSVGELALRISKFDSYRLFTLYENVKERKVMDVSGDQKYYLVFKSPKKEIRIPEYDPKGFFEVDKVNGCILFKITKKNAEDILSMKTAGEKIFHIIRVFEERDAFGKVLSVTDEVEVYNGKWGDDFAFSSFTTENKVDLLTKSLAVQVDKNAQQLNDYKDLLEKYNSEVSKNSDLEKELEALRSERDSLQTMLNEYTGNTYDGTLLSTDTKYIAFENTLENISFTEEQLASALSSMTEGDFEVDNDIDDPKVELDVKIYNEDLEDVKITIYKNNVTIGSAVYNMGFNQRVFVDHGDEFKFVCEGMKSNYDKVLTLEADESCKEFINMNVKTDVVSKDKKSMVKGTINFEKNGEIMGPDSITIGKLMCYIE